MKPLFLFLTVLVLSAAVVAQQSLGDVARKARAQQKPAASMSFDQDSMARPSGVVSTVGQDKSDADQTNQAAAANANGQDAKGSDKDAKDKKAKSDWNNKIDDQKKEIATLQRELDILQREQRLRAAAFYGDAGTQMRDQAKFAQDSRQEQEQLDSKKQALDAAQQKLSDLQEQARKAGASSE
ncbi:MAG TPA: hypothetical protein VIX19_18290 [Terriglobales bacterium]